MLLKDNVDNINSQQSKYKGLKTYKNGRACYSQQKQFVELVQMYNPKMILKIFLILLYLEHFKLSKAKINKMLNLNSKDEFFKEKENNFIVSGLIF